jgi:EAL domain-containing protein (putative c-di-GMP-specific phosphodiesterase class I)
MGIKLLMDDFGSGYSSLSYLTYIPIDIVKLDQSLVKAFLSPEKEKVLKNIIDLVHDLGKAVIVEGVEHHWQYETLNRLGADTIQGYYFSKPVEAQEAQKFLTARRVSDCGA